MIAYVCAIAMVVAGLAFIPAADTKADAPDWSTIDYLADGAGSGQYTDKYKYYCEDGSAINIQKPGFADEAGIYATYPAADIQMDIDGYAVQGTGAVLYLSNFTKKVTEINVTYAGGSTKAYVYYEDGEEGPTTTVDPSAPTTEPTSANPWKSIPNGGSQWYYNNTTKQNISNVVNIQKPGWADEDGVYITVPAGISQVDVNGVTTGVAAIDGAGFVVYLSAMTKKINEVTVTQGLGTSYIQIMNTEGSDDPTEAPTEESTEAPTEETTEAPTEAPTVEPTTETPTEETTEAPTEAPTEETTEAPGDTIDTNNGWLARKADGSFEVGAGVAYDVDGISAIYAGEWDEEKYANIRVSQSSTDPYSVPINVLNSTQNDEWLTQVCYKVSNLDNSKSYKITLKAGDTLLDEKTVNGVESYQYCKGTGWVLPVGETTLTLDVQEQTKPDPPVVQDITITPNTAQIEANYNIWANWTNPEGTAYAYAYLKEVGPGYSVIAANGWDFNAETGQPRTAVDQVNHTRNNEITVEEGETYTFIVESYDAWDQQTGYGEVEITIPGLTPEEKEAKEYLGKIDTSENLALQKAPIVASNEGTATAIVDGNNGTRWQANKEIDNTYFAVDLGGVYVVDKVLVSWEASNARAYEVYLAGEDGEYGVDPVATVSGLPNNAAVYRLSKDINTSARYVKIVVTEWSQNAESYGISPYELAVFGVGEEPTTEAPTETQTEEPSTETPTETSTEAPTETSTEAPTETQTAEPTTQAPTKEPTTQAPTKEPTTEAPTAEPTTQAPTQKPTKAPATTVAPTKLPDPVPVIKYPDKAKVKKAVKKKKSAKKIKVKIKKVKGSAGYQVAVYKSKKKAKKNKKALVKKFVKKTKFTIKSKKFKKKKKLWVKVRAYVLDGSTKVFGTWSKPKKTKKK